MPPAGSVLNPKVESGPPGEHSGSKRPHQASKHPEPEEQRSPRRDGMDWRMFITIFIGTQQAETGGATVRMGRE